MRSDDLRGKRFSTRRPGYDMKEVDTFLEAAGLRLAAMESTDRPAGPLVSDAFLSRGPSGPTQRPSQNSYGGVAGSIEVDAFRKKIRNTFLGTRRSPVKADKVRGKQFSTDDDDYDKKQVDAFLDAAGIRLAAMGQQTGQKDPLVNGAIWAKWADSTRFSTSRHGRVGRYDTAEVDAFRDAVRDTFLGVGRSPMTWRAPPGKQFTTTRRLRPGYDPGRLTPSLIRPNESWPRWSPRTGQKNHWLAAPFSPMSRVGRLNKISNRRNGPSGPNGPTQQDFQPARCRATRRRRSTRSGKRFATRSSGSCNPAHMG